LQVRNTYFSVTVVDEKEDISMTVNLRKNKFTKNLKRNIDHRKANISQFLSIYAGVNSGIETDLTRKGQIQAINKGKKLEIQAINVRSNHILVATVDREQFLETILAL